MLSFWEKDVFTSYDVIIVGAGISGLSTAASLKEVNPGLSVLVLERGLLPTGASTKNAGFACFGSITEVLADLETMSNEAMLELVNMRWQGLLKTRKRLFDQNIDYQNNGGFELLETDHQAIEEIPKLNQLLEPVIGQEVYTLQNEKISKFGFQKTENLIFNQYEGQLHTGKLIRSLWKYCSELGIEIITGANITSINSEGAVVSLSCDKMTWKAKAVAVCTNAFTNQLLSTKHEIKPGRGMVMAIKPNKPIQFTGTFHYEEGYNYFRNYQDKIIFGGGRNLAMENETTTEFEINESIKSKLISDLESIIIPETEYEITDTWTGIMAFGRTKNPIIEQIDKRIFLGARLGGMGVAIGSQVGESLASKIIQSHF